MHMVSRKDLNSAVRASEKSDDGGNSQRRGADKEEATVFVRELDLFVTVILLKDTKEVLSLGKSAKITGIITIGPVVRIHNSSKIAER